MTHGLIMANVPLSYTQPAVTPELIMSPSGDLVW